jgi:hypothetical protein
MAKAQFTQDELTEAVDSFIAITAPRTAPAVGKNSEVTVYGDNPNPYRPPVLPKGEQNEPDEKIDRDNIGIELSGLE